MTIRPRLVLATLMLALVGPLFVDVLSAPPVEASTVTLGGVAVSLDAGTRQVVTVNHRTGDHATVTLWRHTNTGWVKAASATDGRIGYGGLVAGTRRRQGTGTTPLGTYRLRSVFGTHARSAAWKLSYRRIHAGDFWVEDNGSAYYNRYRNQSQGGFRWRLDPNQVNGSERLTDYPRQYEYSVVTSYNYTEQVRYRGAGIFLHVNGSGATAGCVSAPRAFLLAVLNRLDPRLQPLIAIGR